jgi:hypothetical protein
MRHATFNTWTLVVALFHEYGATSSLARGASCVGHFVDHTVKLNIRDLHERTRKSKRDRQILLSISRIQVAVVTQSQSKHLFDQQNHAF